jgi:hypothetical protein
MKFEFCVPHGREVESSKFYTAPGGGRQCDSCYFRARYRAKKSAPAAPPSKKNKKFEFCVPHGCKVESSRFFPAPDGDRQCESCYMRARYRAKSAPAKEAKEAALKEYARKAATADKNFKCIMVGRKGPGVVCGVTNPREIKTTTLIADEPVRVCGLCASFLWDPKNKGRDFKKEQADAGGIPVGFAFSFDKEVALVVKEVKRLAVLPETVAVAQAIANYTLDNSDPACIVSQAKAQLECGPPDWVQDTSVQGRALKLAVGKARREERARRAARGAV